MINLFDNDPAQICNITNLTFEMTTKILELGPCQPKPNELPGRNYPQNNGHRFLQSLYYVILSDGSTVKRDWLTYSKSKSRMYCFHCILFPGHGKEKPNKSWVKEGFRNWSSCTQSIISHETSSSHI